MTRPDEQAPAAPRGRGPGRGPGTSVVLVLLCAVLALATGLGWWWQHGAGRTADLPTAERAISSVPARESGGRAVARLAEEVLGYDARGFDAEVRATRTLLAPSFRSQYDAQMAQVKSETLAERVRLEARVRETAVSSASPDRVVALVFVDQVTSSPLTPTRRVDQVRVLVTVTRDGGEWRVSRMDAF
ncbi:hypothetical protein [Nocardioides aurantiacus]|uniref:Mce-associated membrane protein n=1 Tax=Nocardioides aurantiacus TaxID=86796 RepID=A0A3N2CV36_9ACTN|nr:hypothetical protein [Nocardioides aurantiacus]ROR91278.1 hypothetical protein EDD33_2144 [Nocardioides aurantiacus]